MSATKFNPRYRCFCTFLGRDPAELSERGDDGNIKKVSNLPWTVVFMQWNDHMINHFCDDVGIKRHSVELVRMIRHDGEYDQWLTEKVAQ